MICVSVRETSIPRVVRALEGIDFAEVRLDGMEITADETADLFSRPVRLIATCRPGRYNDVERKELLFAAIEAGAAFVDVELESKTAWRESVVKKAKLHGSTVIVSHHDYQGTPSRKELKGVVDRCFQCGAAIAKIACTVKDRRENARILGLLDDERAVIAIGMGAKGTITRILGPLLGSPFTYAALTKGRETAQGQIDKASTEQWMAFMHQQGVS